MLLRAWIFQRDIRRLQFALAQFTDRDSDSMRDVARLFLYGLVMVQHFMAPSIGFVVADKAIQPRHLPSIDQAHPVKPIGQTAPNAFDSCDIAIHYQAVGPAGQVLRIRPACKLQFLCFHRFLAMGRSRVGIRGDR